MVSRHSEVVALQSSTETSGGHGRLKVIVVHRTVYISVVILHSKYINMGGWGTMENEFTAHG